MANHTERIGINHVAEIAERNNWMFREQPVNDIGIDAYMEFAESSGKSKQLLALQIKSGSSWFKERKDENYIFRDINERQYYYWTTNSLPCIVVLYNPDDNTCIWQKLTSDTIKRTSNGKGKSFFVEVPISQMFLSEKSNEKLVSFTNLPEYIANYNFLLSQKEFMEALKKGGKIKLHSTEWIHKCSGKGNIELIIQYDNQEYVFSYPYWFPFTSYTDVFSQLFPWAQFEADEEFFQKKDENDWREYNCYYDVEEKEWIVVGETFEEFRKKLNPMRCILHSGEVAEYMMYLRLNDLGEAFIKLDEFLSQKNPYVETKPKEEKIK